MKTVLCMLSLTVLTAAAQAQPGQRRDAGPGMPEQRRAELRSALMQPPILNGPGTDPLLDPAPPRRRLTDEERADLRQQLRQQARESAGPEGQVARPATPCSRETPRPSNRNPDANCH